MNDVTLEAFAEWERISKEAAREKKQAKYHQCLGYIDEHAGSMVHHRLVWFFPDDKELLVESWMDNDRLTLQYYVGCLGDMLPTSVMPLPD